MMVHKSFISIRNGPYLKMIMAYVYNIKSWDILRDQKFVKSVNLSVTRLYTAQFFSLSYFFRELKYRVFTGNRKKMSTAYLQRRILKAKAI